MNRKNGLQIVKENKTHHRRRHISVMHLMFWDFIISSMVYLLLGSIDCKREAQEHRTTQIFYNRVKLGLSTKMVGTVKDTLTSVSLKMTSGA